MPKVTRKEVTEAILNIEREHDPHGDHVKLTYNGKFLPYKKW